MNIFFLFSYIVKQFGNWTNTGSCIATGTRNTCGPGLQAQIRNCTDGSTDKCTDADTLQNISCADAGTDLVDCEKQLGDWINEGDCVATGTNSTCGPGFQTQERNCTDGTTDKCTDADTLQNIPCADAGTDLVDCEKQLGDWNNTCECKAPSCDKDAEPRLQTQIRTCIDGTTDLCTNEDLERTISYADAGSALPDCILG